MKNIPAPKIEKSTEDESNSDFSKILRTPKIKKWHWVVMVGVVVCIVVGILIFKYAKNNAVVEYTTVAVSQGDLKQTVSATGSIESAQDVNLNFQISGTLKTLNVKVGDLVKEDMLLAELDGKDYSNQVAQASANLASANATLQKMIAGSTPEDIKVSEQNVSSAQIAYNSSLLNLQNVMIQTDNDILVAEQTVNSAKSDLASAKISLENTINTQNQTLESYKHTALTLMDSHMYIARKSLDIVNSILTDTDKSITLGLKNISTISIAKTSYSVAFSSITTSESYMNTAHATEKSEDVILATDNLLSWLNLVAITLNDTFDVLLASASYSGYTNTELATDKSTIQTEQSTINTSKSALLSARANVVNTQTSQQQTIDEAKNKVTSSENAVVYAQKSLDLVMVSKQAKIDSAKADVSAKQSALQIAQAQLELKKAPPRSVDLASQRAVINQLSAVLAYNKNQLDKTKLFAPMDGVITKINYDVGEQVLSTATFITLLGNMDYEISVDISESDISKIVVGNEADITFDAFGPDQIFPGKVFSVEPAETVISDVVYYKVKIALNDTYSGIKPGMTANIDILSGTRTNVLYVPSRAVVSESGKYFARVLKYGTEVENRDVSLGMKADGGFVEVLSGLQKDELVITFIKEKKVK